MLFAIFGLGFGELVVLGLLCLCPVAIGGVVAVVLVVLALKKKGLPEPKDEDEMRDVGGEG